MKRTRQSTNRNPHPKTPPRLRSRRLHQVRNSKDLRCAPRPVAGQTCFDFTVALEEEKGDAKNE